MVDAEDLAQSALVRALQQGPLTCEPEQAKSYVLRIVQNLAMLIAVVVVFANLAVDLLYTWLDPRIKYGA